MQEVVTRSGWDLREMTTGWQNLSRYHRHETAMARGEFGDRDIRKGREEVWERFLSRWFYQDCAWWQSSLSCWRLGYLYSSRDVDIRKADGVHDRKTVI